MCLKAHGLCLCPSRADQPRRAQAGPITAFLLALVEVSRVVYRNGEVSQAAIDRGWPHQVALPAFRLLGARYFTVHLFCDGLSLCPRGHTFRRNDQDYSVFCFAEHEHAEKFHARFGGEFVDPKTRPKWPGRRRNGAVVMADEAWEIRGLRLVLAAFRGGLRDECRERVHT